MKEPIVNAAIIKQQKEDDEAIQKTIELLNNPPQPTRAEGEAKVIQLNADDGKFEPSELFVNGERWIKAPPHEEQEEWISVKDRLPEIHKRILVFRHAKKGGPFSEGLFEVCSRGIEIEWICNGHGILFDPEFWMPLPEPPKQEKP